MNANAERYRKMFFEEASEHLADVEAGLLGMERSPNDASMLDQVFRGVHSIKGGAATFGLTQVAEFSHALENRLDHLRSTQCDGGAQSLETLLESLDCLKALVDAAQTDQGPSVELSERLAATQCALDSASASVRCGGCDRARSPASTALRTWHITFAPGADAFRNGLDPTLVWRELDAAGELEVRLDPTGLPTLDRMDPQTCYLRWEATLKTDWSENRLREAFFFYADDAELVIAPADESQSAIADTPVSFAQWLVQRGVVSPETMLDALDLQHEQRVPLGQLALRMGAMSVSQVFDTVSWGSRRTERFGETAVTLGYLTRASLAELLDEQARQTPSLGSILLQIDAAPAKVLRSELDEFRRAGGAVADHDQWAAEPTLPSPDGELASENDANQSAPVGPVPDASDDSPIPAVNLEKVKQNGELLGDFLGDFYEHLEGAEKQILLIESNATAEEPLHALYRAFHTMKGVASFFGLTQITELAHAAEDVLNLARDGKLHLSGPALELVLASLDVLRRLAAGTPDLLTCDESPPADADAAALIIQLRGVAAGESPQAPVAATTTCAAESTASTDVAKVPPSNSAAPRAGHDLKETVRVDRSRLDQLVDMIGELVIGEAMVRQEIGERHPGEEVESVAQLGRTVRELQEMSLSLRMVPIAATFQKMHRIVRDVSRKLGKQVHFEVRGEETELDKTMVDQLGDPLMHMVRNAVDHGIELSDARAATGKPVEGRVVLQAYLRSGNFYIELSDDGRGLNRQAILSKAVERGVVCPSDCETIADADVWMLIFAPGFSTAAEVTDVSGRGVGMDVVKRAIESLNGSIEIESEYGRGSTFRVRLPLTMAIVDGLSVSLADETFILPLVSVVESVQPRPHEVQTIVGRGEIVQVRDETIPLVRLHRVFNRPARELDPARALVVIVESDGRRLALLVDELLGQVQAVMKSLETNYQKVPGVAGATILGNGEVAFILDVQGLAKLHAKTQYGKPPARDASGELSTAKVSDSVCQTA